MGPGGGKLPQEAAFFSLNRRKAQISPKEVPAAAVNHPAVLKAFGEPPARSAGYNLWHHLRREKIVLTKYINFRSVRSHLCEHRRENTALSPPLPLTSLPLSHSIFLLFSSLSLCVCLPLEPPPPKKKTKTKNFCTTRIHSSVRAMCFMSVVPNWGPVTRRGHCEWVQRVEGGGVRVGGGE